MLHNFCLSFLPSITAVPREIENNAYTIFFGGGGVNKVIMGNVEVAYGRISLAVSRSLIVSRPGFGIKSLQEMQDAKNNQRDYGMEQQLGSERRDNRTLLGTF